MRTWQREPYGTTCGLCGGLIEKGQPVFLISGEWSKPKERCANCAGEPTPELPDLPIPGPVEILPTPKSLHGDWRGMRVLAGDFKIKQAGDR